MKSLGPERRSERVAGAGLPPAPDRPPTPLGGAQKKVVPKKNGAQERTRTFTAVKPLAPEASASTNSATWAPDDSAVAAGP